MQLKPILQPIETEMRAVDAQIRKRLGSDVVLINQLADHIINSGGKRLRPAITLLAARACGYAEGEEHVLLAAIIEFIHTATLLHDDVVDESSQRRGQDTANAVWGNGASVLTGDFLYSRAFQMMVELDRMSIMDVLADATNRVAEGEVMQLMNCHNPDLTEAAYLEVIDRKTASLFSAGCRLAAQVAGASASRQEAMADYGHHLGVAFQIIDDAMDYNGGPDMGKNIGDDLAEGKITLPLIHAIHHSIGETNQSIRQAIETGDADSVPTMQKAIESTQAMAYTSARAGEEADSARAALDGLAASPFKQALIQLADFTVQRNF